MLDIKLIREKPDFVRQRLASRGAGDEALVEKILQTDDARRKLLGEVEALKSQRNKVSKEIGALMGQKKIEEAEAKKKETRDLGDRIAQLDKEVAECDAKRDELMLQLPNLPHESVPAGKSAEDNPVIRSFGEKPSYAFKPKTHVEL
ncbi:MAG TPA: serine--tRNA ligase, partial [Candidatus Polarisedimenticolia bacterium]|nr:serine--tRNA ligase [Candidatus Polarisedimenticolia bacterium]